jgi:hypothetical protein
MPKMKKIRLKTKKKVRSNVLAKFGERKNSQFQATIKTRFCALFSFISALKDSPNSLLSFQIQIVFGATALKLRKLWGNKKKSTAKELILSLPCVTVNKTFVSTRSVPNEVPK